jgi:hypothetical protein
MPSTPFVYSLVASRYFTSFRVLKLSISAGQRDFWQLHKRAAEMRRFFVGLDGRVDCWVRTAHKGAPGFIDV